MAMACGHLGCQHRSLHIKASPVLDSGYPGDLDCINILWEWSVVLSSIKDNLPLFSLHCFCVSRKATLGKLLRHGVERIWAFPSA